MVSRFWKFMKNIRNIFSAWYFTLRSTKKGKEINIFKSFARSNVFSTKSVEQEVNFVTPNLCIFWLLFICLYHSWSWSLTNFVWMNISGYQNYMSSLLTGFRAEKNHIFRFCAFWGSLSKEVFFSLNTNFVNSVATRSPNL